MSQETDAEPEEWPLVTDEDLRNNAEKSTEGTEGTEEDTEGNDDFGRAIGAYAFYLILFPIANLILYLLPMTTPVTSVRALYRGGLILAIGVFVLAKVIRFIYNRA